MLTIRSYLMRHFYTLLLLAFSLIGAAYIFFQPPFEGFDENAHFSRIREASTSLHSSIFPSGYLDKSISNYSGPIAYKSGVPPFSNDYTYRNFFKNPELIRYYKTNYAINKFNAPFEEGIEVNWEKQHPPLYYFIAGSIYKKIKDSSLKTQFYSLRLLSLVFTILGVFFSIRAASLACEKNNSKHSELSFKYGFLFYPIFFPMFFFEFSRLGNDSLSFLFTGLLAYAFIRWFNDKTSLLKAVSIGFILSLGVLTKAFFIPISAALLLFFVLKYKNIFLRPRVFKNQLSLLINVFFIFFIPFVTTLAWFYLNKSFGEGYNFGSEIDTLNKSGGILAGLRANFNWSSFFYGLISPFVSFVWAGSWSLVHIKYFLYLPIYLIVLPSFYFAYKNKASKVNFYYQDLLALFFIFLYFGLLVHGFIAIAINGIAGSPGWYFHIIFPWMAPVLGLGILNLLEVNRINSLFKSITLYLFLFHISGLWLYLTLYGGCSVKSNFKQFEFEGIYGCFDNIYSTFSNLKVIGEPYIGVIFLGTGFVILFLLVQALDIQKKK